MFNATLTHPDLTSFTCLDNLGLKVTGQPLEPDRVVLACRVVDPDAGATGAVARASHATP